MSWAEAKDERYVRVTFSSRLARDVREEQARVHLANLGWKAVKSRTFSMRQEHRNGGRGGSTQSANPFQAPEAEETPASGCLPALKPKLMSRIVDKRVLRLRLGQLNIQGGLKSKIAELEQYLGRKRYDIVALAETRLRPASRLKVKGYKMFSFPNEDGQGGVAVLVSLDLCQYCKKLKASAPNQGWVRIKGSAGTSDIFICSAYMPQESDTAHARSQAWDQLGISCAKYRALGNTVVLGDLNAQVGEASTARESRRIGPFMRGERTPNGQLLADFLREHDMVSTAGHCRPPNRPGFWYTRYDVPRDKYTQIDYILVDGRQHSLHRSQFCVDYTDLGSDHHLLSAYYYWPRRTHSRSRNRKVKRFLYEKLVDPAANSNADAAYAAALRASFGEAYAPGVGTDRKDGDMSCDSVVGDFLKKLEQALESSIGSKTVSKRFSRPWFDREVKQAIQDRRQKYKIFRESKCEANWVAYCAARRECRKLVRSKQLEAWNKLVEKVDVSFERGNTRQLWSLLRRVLPSKASMGNLHPIRDKHGNLASSMKDRLEAWAQHQTSLGTPLSDPFFDEKFRTDLEREVEQLEKDSLKLPPNDMDKPFTQSELETAIKRLKPGKAAGLDGIRNEALKSAGEVLQPILLRLFNWLNKREITPRDWGRSLVAYLYKKGDRESPGNYRGISLISCIGKLYLSMWASRLTKVLEEKLVEEQGGFRAGRSTSDLVFTLNDTLLRRRRSGKHTFLFFIDFRKAFDTVWHTGLWKRLWDVGIRGKAWRILRSLYSNVSSSVIVQGDRSRWVRMHQGVRQGCPLSPYLFSIFVNTLAERLREVGGRVMVGNSSLYSLLYADDIVLLADNPGELQKMINVVDKFCRQWRMSVNASKSKAMIIRSPKAARQHSRWWTWQYRNKPVPIVDRYEYLGVWLTSNLSWDHHIEVTSNSARKATAKLHRAFGIRKLPIRLKRLIWLILGRPRLEYACQIWKANKTQERKLESIQHDALRRIFRTNSKTKQEALRFIAGCPSLAIRRNKLRLLFLPKILAKDPSSWPRRCLDTPPPACRILGRSQAHWWTYTERLISSEDSLRSAHDVLKSHLVECDGTLRVIRNADGVAVANPFTEWRKAVEEYVIEVSRKHILSLRASTLALIQTLAQDIPEAHRDMGITRPLPIVDAAPSPSNWLRFRFLTGMSSLNSMMSRITKTSTRRSSTCPVCSGDEETVMHFLRTCPDLVATQERELHAKQCPDSFRSSSVLTQCLFILGCPPKGGVTVAQEAANLNLIDKLWARRRSCLTSHMKVAAPILAPPSRRGQGEGNAGEEDISPSLCLESKSVPAKGVKRLRQRRIEDFLCRYAKVRPARGVEANGNNAMPG